MSSYTRDCTNSALVAGYRRSRRALWSARPAKASRWDTVFDDAATAHRQAENDNPLGPGPLRGEQSRSAQKILRDATGAS
jgi:hypothetical protein